MKNNIGVVGPACAISYPASANIYKDVTHSISATISKFDTNYTILFSLHYSYTTR